MRTLVASKSSYLRKPRSRQLAAGFRWSGYQVGGFARERYGKEMALTVEMPYPFNCDHDSPPGGLGWGPGGFCRGLTALRANLGRFGLALLRTTPVILRTVSAGPPAAALHSEL